MSLTAERSTLPDQKAPPAGDNWRERKRRRERRARTFAFIVLSIGAIIFAAPFLFMVSTSFKTEEQASKMSPFEAPSRNVTVTLGGATRRVARVEGEGGWVARLEARGDDWLVQPLDASLTPVGDTRLVPSARLTDRRQFAIYADNYPQAMRQMDFWILLRNTCVIVYGTMVGVLVSSSLVAYGFARLQFPLKNLWFTLMLSTMMLPQVAVLLPLYAFYKSIGWVNTFLPLVIPSFFGSAYHIFLLRQFFMTLPRELEDAARIDGSSSFGIFYRIFLPLSKPALITVGIFTFMFSWNNLFGPLIYLRTPDKYTLSIGLAQFNGLYSTEYGPLMAASIVIVSPLLVLFFAAQKYFVEGIVLSGLGGR